MCGGLALATWGCGFLNMGFNGENSQTMQEANACEDLSAEYSSEIPLLVELRTDKAGTTIATYASAARKSIRNGFRYQTRMRMLPVGYRQGISPKWTFSRRSSPH
jgi:hypothetical protein